MICTTTTSYRRKRWLLPTHDAPRADALARELRLPPLIARLLLSRGLADPASAAAFLEPKFKDLHSPWLLPNMRPAAERIAHAVREKHAITLYGDYDVDGITGTAMLWHTLKSAGADPHIYIPHRVDEGYGLNPEAIQSIIDSAQRAGHSGAGTGGGHLLITIDCGITALEPITLARRQHLDVIISDHHEIPSQLPPATAIIHPRLPSIGVSEYRSVGVDSTAHPDTPTPRCPDTAPPPYPNPDLCGAGVAFKLAWAIAQTLCNAERVTETYRNLLLEFTALAALGTIADVVPLMGGGGENRILVKYGLAQLARTQLPGLQALIAAAGYGPNAATANRGPLDTTAVGFALAPRLNAAGRMGHANDAIELLTTATGPRATEIATTLESQNKSRQATERQMLETAKEQLHASLTPMDLMTKSSMTDSLPSILVLSHESFHAGVVGIVASRIVDLYHRPTFILATSPTEAHGSARSIPGFNLSPAIEHCRDLLTSGGGHAMAGGVKLPLDRLEAFRARLNDYARTNLTPDMLIPTLNLDDLLPLEDASPATIALLDQLAPFGRGNPHPRFLVQSVRITAPPRRVGATGAHLQLSIAKGPRHARCIAFKMGDLEPQLPVGTELHLVVEPKIDLYTGTPRVDLQILDLARTTNEPFNI